jgi:hypothetical protein
MGHFVVELLLDSSLDAAVVANQFVSLTFKPNVHSPPRPSNTPGTVTGKVLAANYTGQVYMWSDFNFVAPYHFEYEDYPNDYQRICYKFDDKRYFTVRFVVAPEVKNRHREAISETHVTGWTIEDMDLTVGLFVFRDDLTVV